MAELFPGFLADETLYLASRAHWATLLRRETEGLESIWREPWFEPLPLSVEEGNPIFSAVDAANRRGLRILQFPPEEVTSDEETEFDWWLDTFAGDEPEAINELVISCSLTEENSGKAAMLIRRWVRGETSTRE